MGQGVAALVAVSLALAACGGESDEPNPTVTPSPSAAPTEQAQTLECGEIAFTPQSDNGAFSIEATGTNCDTAAAVATAAEGESGTFTAEGFECTGELDESAQLPSTRWSCIRGDSRVTFSTS